LFEEINKEQSLLHMAAITIQEALEALPGGITPDQELKSTYVHPFICVKKE